MNAKTCLSISKLSYRTICYTNINSLINKSIFGTRFNTFPLYLFSKQAIRAHRYTFGRETVSIKIFWTSRNARLRWILSKVSSETINNALLRNWISIKSCRTFRKTLLRSSISELSCWAFFLTQFSQVVLEISRWTCSCTLPGCWVAKVSVSAAVHTQSCDSISVPIWWTFGHALPDWRTGVSKKSWRAGRDTRSRDGIAKIRIGTV